MHFSYMLHPQERIVKVTVRAGATSKGFEKLMTQVLADSQYRPGFHFLVDRRGLRTPPEFWYVYQVASILWQHRALLGRWASVADDHCTYGMALMLATLTQGSGLEIRAFQESPPALRWLRGLQSEDQT
jgi:hypothetical protein